MEKVLKWAKIWAIGVVALLLLLVVGSWKPLTENLGVGGYFEANHFPNAIGTASSPVTLTNSYTGAGSASSTRMSIPGMANMVIAGTYTPKSYGSHALILVERSIDGGTTFLPYMTITPETGDVLVNTSGTSTTNGSPFVIPGNTLFTSASGTAIGFSFDLTLAADFTRIKAREVTTSTAGTLNVQVLNASQ